jgi:hypothetical protein
MPANKRNPTPGTHPAFPTEMGRMTEGMTMREYIAAKAMEGLLSSPLGYQIKERQGQLMDPKEVAAAAYRYADAMIEQAQK